MKVLFLGASGSIGGEALRQCLCHPKITSVVAFVRRALPAEVSDHAKLQTVMIKDFSKWSEDILLPHVDAAAMICAMGSYRGNVNVDMEYPLAFQTAFAPLLEKQPKREPFRFIHLSGKWVVQEQDAKLWVNDYPRKLKFQGLYELRSLELAKEHAAVWKAWMLRPGGVITNRMRVPGYLAQLLLGDDYVIRNEELAHGPHHCVSFKLLIEQDPLQHLQSGGMKVEPSLTNCDDTSLRGSDHQNLSVITLPLSSASSSHPAQDY
ncbi:hypothetical protein DER44DRAFT_671172 [Fusarium oxysporum]|nr:hypothetical protein DER44DRAFT_671172 [Fusarium oxysporum]